MHWTFCTVHTVEVDPAEPNNPYPHTVLYIHTHTDARWETLSNPRGTLTESLENLKGPAGLPRTAPYIHIHTVEAEASERRSTRIQTNMPTPAASVDAAAESEEKRASERASE